MRIVSPDVGRAGMAGRYAEELIYPLGAHAERRLSYTRTGDHTRRWRHCGHKPIIIDDLMASGKCAQAARCII